MAEAVAFRARYISDRLPPQGAKVEVLCQKGNASYALPLLCSWTESGWVVAGTQRRLRYEVTGWRDPRPKKP